MVNRAHFVILVLAYRFLVSLSAEPDQTKESYVVYMGSPSAGEGGNAEAVRAAHLEMLLSIVPSDELERASLTQSYHHAFEGFAAVLTEEEAAALSGHERVVSVFRDRALQLHTTRSWDFLDVQSGLLYDRLGHRASGDVIVGIVDTGVWPESPSFNDAGMREVPARWRGVCMEGPDFKKSNCNKKLIGARYYGNLADSAAPASNSSLAGADPASAAKTGSPRDTVGHGTHTASTAAGAVVADADYYGLARGVAKGGAPASRVAVYKACSLGGCSGSAVLKAIDDAVSDGVDVISISIGMSSSVFQSDFFTDPIALGAFHAHQKGVLVACSGGNDGPNPYTVVNSAPWILTVAASSIDRTFQSSIVLGNGTVVKGVAINFSNQSLSGGQYPLVIGPQVAGRYTPVSEASNCKPGSLDAQKAAGKIVVCVGTDPTVSRRVKKLVAEGAGARGLIIIDDIEKAVPFDAGSFPFSQVGTDAGAQILEYMNSTKSPTAVILPAEDVKEFKPAPVVASFSARGPGGFTEAILKPDLMAPGVSILAAAVPPHGHGGRPRRQETLGLRHQVRHLHGLPARRRRRCLRQVGPPGLVPLHDQISSHDHSGDDEQPRTAGGEQHGGGGDGPRHGRWGDQPTAGAQPGPGVRHHHAGLPQLPLLLRLQGAGRPQALRRRPLRLPPRRALAGPDRGGGQLPVHLRAAAPGREGGRRVAHRHERGALERDVRGGRRGAGGPDGEGVAGAAGVLEEVDDGGVRGELRERRREQGVQVRLRHLVGWRALGQDSVRG